MVVLEIRLAIRRGGSGGGRLDGVERELVEDRGGWRRGEHGIL